MKAKASLAIGAACLSLAGHPAHAYDGPILNALPAPLLKMPTNPDVVPRSTTIHLSRAKVELRYRIENTGPTEKAYFLYLPLAPIDSWMSDNEEAFAADPAQDPLGLAASINDRPAPFEIAARAVFLGQDVTTDLKAAGLPLVPFGKATDIAMGALSSSARSALTERGVISHWGEMWHLPARH